MQRSTTFLVSNIIIYLIFKVYKTRDFIILSSHMQDIKLRIIITANTSSNINKIMNKFNMTIKRSIENGSKSFLIFLINPSGYLLFCLFFVQLLTNLYSPLYKSRCMVNIKLDQLFLIIKT